MQWLQATNAVNCYLISRNQNVINNYLSLKVRNQPCNVVGALKQMPNIQISSCLTIGSCFSEHYRVMEYVGTIESTK